MLRPFLVVVLLTVLALNNQVSAQIDRFTSMSESANLATAPLTVPEDSNWSDEYGGYPGVGGSNGLNFVAIDQNGFVYIGNEREVGGTRFDSRVVRWDGASWSGLGTYNGNPLSVAIDSNRNLYAGNGFTVDTWDGGSWSTLGSPSFDGQVWSMGIDSQDSLYAGGAFISAGADTVNRIAKWNGSSWVALGDGLPIIVSTISISRDDTLYAAGPKAQPTSVHTIWRWDGVDWSQVGSANFSGPTSSAVDTNGVLYIGTAFGVQVWTGSSWDPVGFSSSLNLFDKMAVNPVTNNLFVAGNFSTAGGAPGDFIAEYDGSTWSGVGGGLSSAPQSIAFDNTGNLFVAGRFATAGGVAVNHIAKWDGSTWHALGSGGGFSARISDFASNASGNPVAGGWFSYASEVAAEKVARMEGGGWAALAQPGLRQPATGLVEAVTIDADGDVIAGGLYDVSRWTGSDWSSLGSGFDNWVWDLGADSAGSVFAGGRFTNAGGTPASYVAEWDGVGWSALGAGVNNWVYAVLPDNKGNLYVGGEFTNAGGAPASKAAVWNGSSWSALGSGTNFRVEALVFDNDSTLIAGGAFTEADGAAANHVARWDGSSWSPIGNGVNFIVQALALAEDGTLFAGGQWGPSTGIAKWDGTTWSNLGSGVDSVFALFVKGNKLYVGGDFLVAGGRRSSHFAVWTDPNVAVAVASASVSSDTSIDFGGSTAVDLVLSGVSGSGTITALRYESLPDGSAGISLDTVFANRWVIEVDGDLEFGPTSEIRFKVSEIPDPGFTDGSTITIFRRDEAGVGSFVEITTSYDPINMEIVGTGFTSFSEFALASGSFLPVELTSFDVSVDDHSAKLRWTTATEENNAGFEIQHALLNDAVLNDQTIWRSIGFTEGSGTTIEPRVYSYRINNLSPGSHAFRLRQIDFDGSFGYSNVIEATVGLPGPFVLESVYPNPFKKSTRLRFVVAREQNVELILFDALGRRVKTLLSGHVRPSRLTTFELQSDGLSAGSYFVELRGEAFSAATRLVIVK